MLERLAENWELLKDGPGLRLRLRPNVQFHDGTPLTAGLAAQIVRDFVKRGGGLSYGGITRVDAEGDAIVIRTREPEGFLLTDLAESQLSPANRPHIGTGPYAVVRTAPAIELRVFDRYYRGRPPIETVRFRSYQTQRSAWAAMMRGEIDAVHEVSRDAVEFIEAESTVKTYSFLRPYYTALGFNIGHPILRNVAVRRALSLAIDRPALIDQALRGRGQPAQGPIWPHHWAYTSAPRAYSYNPEAAKLLLDSAGYRLGHENTPGRMPSRFSFSCLLWAQDPRFERLALVVQKQLYDVGVAMEIVPVSDLKEWGTRLGTGRYEAFLSDQTSGRSLGWLHRFWHSPAPGGAVYLNSGYRSADAVLDRLRRAVSDEDTRAAVDDLQNVFYEDPPAVFLAWSQVSRAIRSDFTVPTESSPDIMGSLWQWRREPHMVAKQ